MQLTLRCMEGSVVGVEGWQPLGDVDPTVGTGTGLGSLGLVDTAKAAREQIAAQ